MTTNFIDDTPVFTDPEVADHFLSCLNNQTSSNEEKLDPADVWKWLRTPPVQTVLRLF